MRATKGNNMNLTKSKKGNNMKAYHFTGATLSEGYPIPEIGETLIYDGYPVIIPDECGLYASAHPFDALKYAHGNMLHLVKLGGTVAIGHKEDRWTASERTIIKTIDASGALRKFACDQAMSVAHFWHMPEVVKEYLTSRMPSLRKAARTAAIAAARKAPWAVWAAIEATREAAWEAAFKAAMEATRENCIDTARAEFKHLVTNKFEKG